MNFISKCQRWHAWQGSKQLILSDEDNKKLTYHSTPDAVVNYLFLAGHKEVARELNERIKALRPQRP